MIGQPAGWMLERRYRSNTGQSNWASGEFPSWSVMMNRADRASSASLNERIENIAART
jgi:hypothetical protein